MEHVRLFDGKIRKIYDHSDTVLSADGEEDGYPTRIKYIFRRANETVEVRVFKKYTIEDPGKLLSRETYPLSDFLVKDPYGAVRKKLAQKHWATTGLTDIEFLKNSDGVPPPKKKVKPVRKAPSKYPTGTRVLVSRTWHHEQEGDERGTVVEWGQEAPSGTFSKAGEPRLLSIIMDKHSSYLRRAPFGDQLRRIAWIKTECVTLLSELVSIEDTSHYQGIRPDIGIVVKENIKIKGYNIAPRTVGRIIRAQYGGDVSGVKSLYFCVYFPQARSQGFHPATSCHADENKTYEYCTWVEASRVDIGCWDPETCKVLAVFPSSASHQATRRTRLKAGTFVQYQGDQPHKFSICLDGITTSIWSLGRGSILEVTANEDTRERTVHCRIIAGPSPDALGAETLIPSRSLVPLKEKILLSGETVEVVAEIVFKTHALHGRKGTVVLAQDASAEVGVEFEKNIGAGSLDGIGQEGHCLYISASALKKSE